MRHANNAFISCLPVVHRRRYYYERMCEVGIFRKDSVLQTLVADHAQAESRFLGRTELFTASKKAIAEFQSNHKVLNRTRPKLYFGFDADDVVFW